MTRSEKLRTEADQRGAAFFQSASATAEQFRPSRMLDQIVGAIDPDFALLDRIATKVKRNPVVLLAVVGGLWLLMRQPSGDELPPKSKTRQGMRSLRLSHINLEGDENDDIDNAKRP